MSQLWEQHFLAFYQKLNGVPLFWDHETLGPFPVTTEEGLHGAEWTLTGGAQLDGVNSVPQSPSFPRFIGLYALRGTHEMWTGLQYYDPPGAGERDRLYDGGAQGIHDGQITHPADSNGDFSITGPELVAYAADFIDRGSPEEELGDVRSASGICLQTYGSRYYEMGGSSDRWNSRWCPGYGRVHYTTAFWIKDFFGNPGSAIAIGWGGGSGLGLTDGLGMTWGENQWCIHGSVNGSDGFGWVHSPTGLSDIHTVLNDAQDGKCWHFVILDAYFDQSCIDEEKLSGRCWIAYSIDGGPMRRVEAFCGRFTPQTIGSYLQIHLWNADESKTPPSIRQVALWSGRTNDWVMQKWGHQHSLGNGLFNHAETQALYRRGLENETPVGG